MSLTYARIDAIQKRLEGRVSIVNETDVGILGLTGTKVGTDLINLIGESIEEEMNLFLGMVYFMPLLHTHKYLSSIAEKWIISEMYLTYFPVQGEYSDGTDNFGSILRQQAINSFQVLFDGLGIFIPGATNHSNQLTNDEDKQQMLVKAVFLPGERVKKYIGYDYDEDGIPDTDLFIRNSNVDPSMYTAADFGHLQDGSEPDVVDGVRVKPSGGYDGNVDDIVSFW